MAIETNVLVVGWNRAVPGREGVAAETFAASINYYEKLQKTGKLTSFEPLFLQVHGGDFNGFFLLRGTAQNLDWIRTDEEFVDILLRANHCLTGVGVIPGYSGNQIQDMMTRWVKTTPR